MVCNFGDFCEVLTESGFSMSGGNAHGIFTAIPVGWENQQFSDSPIRWHTGKPDTDPWEWRMRVLAERNDVAYAKMFFGVGGFITKEWYPYFYAMRRSLSFGEEYRRGTVTNAAKRIYDTINAYGLLAVHEIKRFGGFGRDEKSTFERALIELQMQMAITACGQKQRQTKNNKPYGWPVTVFCTPEDFWAARGMTLADMDPVISEEKILEQIYHINPDAEKNNALKFIRGR
ncbi:MAG TPA: hypothetical protein PK629_07265 [Oscillospiraceae bacterium]|nr:hypothetical protein [Oscillospiraceae bacterium]HPF56112.1 hypothetical protein [Clostridiales bacterium]HPK34354.1 hypothetical protein [Oscillospiraceae bacterium]HPR75133.1 hypothetical protein [Oscillospiraceae bacterium]